MRRLLLLLVLALLAVPSAALANNGTLKFDGTFAAALPDATWPRAWGNCESYDSLHVEIFKISSACNPSGDGHYRTDLISPYSVYPAGTPTCTSVPVRFSTTALPTPSSYLQVAEEKTPIQGTPGWAFQYMTYFSSSGNLVFMARPLGNWEALYVGPSLGGSLPQTWHTLSVCQNSGQNSTTGRIYSFWLDGKQQAWNHSGYSGTSPINAQIIWDGSSQWPLVLNDYTGGSPANTLSHGDPLVYNMTGLCPGSSCTPPMPPGGWNSP